MSIDNLTGHDLNLNNLLTLYKNNKLPSKILLSGKKGIGKSLIVFEFLLKVFNQENSNLLIKNNTHSNVLNIKKKNDKKSIEIDQIREIIKFINQSSFNNKSRFVIIDDVEFLNVNSSNALLKSLEEPNNNVYFFLIYDSDNKILDTIKSRCLEIKIKLNKEDVKLIVNNYFNDKIYEKLNESLVNFYSTPKFIISLVIYLEQNNLALSDMNINKLIKNIIDNKHYNKHTFTEEYLNYIIELFFYNHINITKKFSYKLKKYYFSKLSNIKKFNLDYESFFLEFKDNLLSE
tara:strand:+ start:1255 stop:2124 length:870 start_codon:yes stop_codon:yes gene_type:complete